MSCQIVVNYADETIEQFERASDSEARILASHLEKEARVASITINGEQYLNTDQYGLYLHRVGRCPLCLLHQDGKCDHCGENTRDASAEGGPIAGYYSVKPSHYHSRAVEGVNGHEGIHEILCLKCQQQDRLEVYEEKVA